MDPNPLEEVFVLRSAYCGGDEFECDEGLSQLLDRIEAGESVTYHFAHPLEFSLRLQSALNDDYVMDDHALKFSVDSDYPNKVPIVRVHGPLSNAQTAELNALLESEVAKAKEDSGGYSFIFPMAQQSQECAVDFLKAAYPSPSTAGPSKENVEDDDILEATLMRIDHMRSKTKYVKTICEWCDSLSLTGRLLFFKKLILLIMEGSREDLKTFAMQLKTRAVDVDSTGKPCKEKMSQLMGSVTIQARACSTFEVHELEDKRTLLDTLQHLSVDHFVEWGSKS